VHHQRGEDRRAARILLQIMQASIAYHTAVVSAIVDQGADQPVSSASGVRRAVVCRARSTTSTAGATARSWVRRRRNQGSEGYLIQPFLAPINQTSAKDGWGGSAEKATDSRSRSSGAHARGTGSRLHNLLTGCRWPTSSRAVRAGKDILTRQTSRKPRRDDDSTPAAAWHEPRVTHHRTRCPNNASLDISHAVAGHVNIRGGGHESKHEAGGRTDSRRHHVKMISMARPLLADPEWVLKAQAARDDENQTLHCLQSGLSGPPRS